MREAEKERDNSEGSGADATQDLESKSIRFFFLMLRDVRSHVMPMAMIEVTELVTENKHNGGAVNLPKQIVDVLIARCVRRNSENLAWPMRAAGQVLRPLIFEHCKIIGHGLKAAA